jgi:hypothetical protein
MKEGSDEVAKKVEEQPKQVTGQTIDVQAKEKS